MSYKTDPTLAFPTFRRLFTVLGRAIRMRCPHCGGAKLLKSYFHLKDRCPTCGLTLNRGESDYYLGGMMFNIIMAEGIFALGFGIALYITWPNVPWDTIQWVLAIGMIAFPILLYPLSQVVWLAFDLAFRPPVDGETDATR
jgi:uncharacterized protein (DUF983 family)